METLTIEVQSRIIGQSGTSFDPVLLELVEERITVTELIRRTVEEQIRYMLVGRKMATEAIHQALDRQYLTVGEIAAQSEDGKISLHPSPDKAKVPQIDTKSEVKKALKAFAAGRFHIFAGGRHIESLDEELNFKQQAKVVFLRLMPLAGG